MEPVKCNKTNLIVLIACFLFLLMAGCAFAQPMTINRVLGYDSKLGIETTVRYPDYGIPISSKINKKDLMALSIRADSIIGHVFNSQVFVETLDAEKYKSHNLIITFDNGAKISLKPLYAKDYYIEYVVTHIDTDAMSKSNILSIEFADGIKYSINKEYSTFFIEFLKLIS